MVICGVYEAHVVYLWRLFLDVCSVTYWYWSSWFVQWNGMIDSWISSGKDSMTWHFIHMWCSNMTNFQTLPGSASEIFCKDFGSTKITLFFGGEMKQSTTREFLTFLRGRSSWWETPQAFHTKKVFHKMTNQNNSYTFLRWWFQIFIIMFTTPIPWVYIDDPIWLLTAISFPWGVEIWNGSFPPKLDFTVLIAWDKEISTR